ncbi:EndoU domain-containing protein [Pseudofulvibacter geojedonensis]|uniref:EndoU domain-containing protein n=1 Tax=Pseudofulvibacter geojedonensis TaxID=1123758 RepID=A0ABW3HZX3_9FLAO
MKIIIKHILYLVLALTFTVSQAQCWFSSLVANKNAANATEEFKTFVKNDEDAFFLYKKLYTAGKPNEVITNVNVLEFFKKLNADELTSLESKILNDLDGIQLTKFVDDFGIDISKLTTINDVPDLINAWESLSLASVDNIIRTDTDVLTKLDDYFKKYSNNVDDFNSELNAVIDKADYLRKLGIVRHTNWVSISNISNKVLARKPHVLEVENLIQTNNYTPPGSSTSITLEGFTGVHSEKALMNYTNTHGGTYSIKNKSTPNAGGAYEGQPVITIGGKDYVKVNGVKVEFSPNKFGGTSSFFPDSWDIPKVLEEVEHAIKNNHGKVNPTNPGSNVHYGYSSNGKVKIHFYYNINNGSIISYFPKI